MLNDRLKIRATTGMAHSRKDPLLRYQWLWPEYCMGGWIKQSFPGIFRPGLSPDSLLLQRAAVDERRVVSGGGSCCCPLDFSFLCWIPPHNSSWNAVGCVSNLRCEAWNSRVRSLCSWALILKGTVTQNLPVSSCEHIREGLRVWFVG